MSNLQPFRTGSLSSRVGRELTRLNDRADLALACTSAAADIEAAKLDGLQLLAGRAMQGVALVSQLEQQLAPHRS